MNYPLEVVAGSTVRRAALLSHPLLNPPSPSPTFEERCAVQVGHTAWNGVTRQIAGTQVSRGFTAAAIPMDDPYCSCRLTGTPVSRGVQLQSLWMVPTAAAG